MKRNSLSIFRQQSFVGRAYIVLLALGFGILDSGIASAKQPFKQFSYVAGPVLTSPGEGSTACLDLGILECPLGHACSTFSYTGDGAGKPGFGKTNIEVCIQRDQNTKIDNAAGGTCSPSAGFAQITYDIRKKSQKVLVFGLLGQTCEFVGGSQVASLVQNLTVTAGPLTGNMSITSLVTDGAGGFLSFYGVERSPL